MYIGNEEEEDEFAMNPLVTFTIIIVVLMTIINLL